MVLYQLRGPAVFVASFLLVCGLSYIPFISCLVVYTGRLVVAVGFGAILSIAFARFIDRVFGHDRKKFVDPKDKAVFITGCDTGFGHELALRLHKFGFHVYAGCLFPSANGGETLRTKGFAEGRLEVLQLDVTKADQVSAAATRVKEDIVSKKLELFSVVNNAGISAYCEFEWVPMETYEKMMDVNAMGSVRVMKAFLPMLRESAGRIVIVSSLSGRYAVPGFVGYSMTKHAQVALADGLRRELKKFGIAVSLVEPGAYKTPMGDIISGLNLVNKSWQDSPEEMKRFYGEPYYASFKRHMEMLATRANPKVSEPVDCIEDAVTAEHPKLRYVPGSTDVKIRGYILPYMPYFVQDYIMGKAGAPGTIHCRHTNNCL